MNSLLPRRFHGLAADEMLVFRIVWQLSNICKWRTLIAHTHESHTHRTHTHWKWQITKYVYQNAFRRSTKITIKILHRRIILNAFNRKPVALIAFRYVNSNAAMLWFIWKMQSVQFTKAKSLREARILEHGRNHKSTQTQTRWNCTMIRTKKKKIIKITMNVESNWIQKLHIINIALLDCRRRWVKERLP